MTSRAPTDDQVSDGIADLLAAGLFNVAERCCTPAEIAKVGLCLEFPSPETDRLLDQAHERISSALAESVAELLNGILNRED